MGKKLVLAGAGHAHMVILQNISEILERGHSVTVIGPEDSHYYSGMGPGLLGGTYQSGEICFKSRQKVESCGGIYIRDKLQKIDGGNRRVFLEGGRTLEYDVLSCNCGSFVKQVIPGTAECKVYPVKPIGNLLAARKRICEEGKKKTLRIVIAGGGPSAAEIAGNIIQLTRQNNLVQPVIQVYCKGRFMGRFSGSVQRACKEFLEKKSVEFLENNPVVDLVGGELMAESGVRQRADMIFLAMGVIPSTVFADSGMQTGLDGGLAVNQYLHSVEYPEILGGGDCISFQPKKIDKVGVYAVRQNPVLYHNVLAMLEGGKLRTFDPGDSYLLIFNLGSGYGVMQKGRFFWKGKAAFALKDFIDRRFMRKFQ